MADSLGSLLLVALSLFNSLALAQLPPPETQTVTMSALGLSFAKQIKASRTFGPFITKLAHRYANLTGHRAHGLRYDDILIEESAAVQKVQTPSNSVQESSR